jgi:hypothetical protein
MKDLAHAVDKDKEIEYSNIEAVVQEMVDLYQSDDRTYYELALLAIQIAWWADPLGEEAEKYGKEVSTLCQEMKEAEPDFDPESPLGDVLQHLRMEASEALAYVREQSDRVRRRSRALKWGDAWVHRDVVRPRVLPRRRRDILKLKEKGEGGLDRMDTDDEDDLQGHEEDDNDMDTGDYDEDEYDEDDEEGEEEGTSDKHESHGAGGVRDSIEVATPISGIENSSRGKIDISISKGTMTNIRRLTKSGWPAQDDTHLEQWQCSCRGLRLRKFRLHQSFHEVLE